MEKYSEMLMNMSTDQITELIHEAFKEKERRNDEEKMQDWKKVVIAITEFCDNYGEIGVYTHHGTDFISANSLEAEKPGELYPWAEN